MKGLGSNKTKENIIQCSKAMGVLHDFLTNFDELNQVPSTNGAHSSPSFKEDVKLIVNELNTARVFSVTSNDRKHHSFQKPKDILHAKPKDDIITYVSDHLKRKYFKNLSLIHYHIVLDSSQLWQILIFDENVYTMRNS